MESPFDDEFRRRLEALKRLVARALAGRGGVGRSTLKERGGRVEFEEHRPYVAGDDPKDIDWSVYARLETLVVKEFAAPSEAHLLLLVDRSDSMKLWEKERALLQLAAALAYLGLASGARVACVSSRGGSAWVTGVERFSEVLDTLTRLPSGGVADLPAAVKRAPPAGAGRRTAVLLSDFYEAEETARALAALRSKGAHLVCGQILAPEEVSAPDVAAIALTDAESGEALSLELNAETRTRFSRAADEFIEERFRIAGRHGARLVQVPPAEDLLHRVERVIVGTGR